LDWSDMTKLSIAFITCVERIYLSCLFRLSKCDSGIFFTGYYCTNDLFKCNSCWSVQKVYFGFTNSQWAGSVYSFLHLLFKKAIWCLYSCLILDSLHLLDIFICCVFIRFLTCQFFWVNVASPFSRLALPDFIMLMFWSR